MKDRVVIFDSSVGLFGDGLSNGIT